jgi:uncharacterized protein (DUF1501 family)
MAITRRIFMRGGAMALVGTAVVPAFLERSVLAQANSAKANGKRLVVLFQRGAADGLNLVVPYREQAYYALRPTIAIQPNQVLDLDGFFGLHPAMQPLLPLYKSGHLAIIQAAGSPDPSRSHFDAQDFMESGTPGIKSTQDGWLNRALRSEDMLHRKPETAFRAVALGPVVPRTLVGQIPAVAIGNVQDFSVGGRQNTPKPSLLPANMVMVNGQPVQAAPGTPVQPQPAPSQQSLVSQSFEAMYAGSVDAVLHGTGNETFEAVKMLQSTDPAHYTPSNGAAYPKSQFGNSMKQIAQLMKANLGVEAAFADIGGWDTHQNQGAATGQLAGRLTEFSQGIAAFWQDMGDNAENVVLVTMSEFGRTAHQNGTGGTDHGHANVMFVLGGPVKGGKVYGRWPGLAPEQLNEGRDLVVTTDFRQVLGEAAYKTLGARNLDVVFPGAGLHQQQFLGLLRS